jgi:hypothetical protein
MPSLLFFPVPQKEALTDVPDLFEGGNFLLGARLLGNETIFEHGLRLVDSAWHSYASTA